MKFPKNNKKQSFSFLALLSSCAIILSLEALPIKSPSKERSLEPATKQQINSQKSQGSKDSLKKDNDKLVEEIELDREWEDISGDDPEQRVLMMARMPV